MPGTEAWRRWYHRNNPGRPTPYSDLKRAHCVFRVVVEPVEEMLGVIEDLAALACEETNGALDHLQIFLKTHPQHLLSVQFPALADDGDHRRIHFEQLFEQRVLMRPGALLVRHAESGQPGSAQSVAGHLLIKLHILGIRAGKAALDVMHAEAVQPQGDLDLLIH